LDGTVDEKPLIGCGVRGRGELKTMGHGVLGEWVFCKGGGTEGGNGKVGCFE